MRCEDKFTWTAYEGLHRRSVTCVPEIRLKLTPTNAENWANDSRAFAEQLEREDLPCAEGIEITRAWIRNARLLLSTMYGPGVLPAGCYGGLKATPTKPGGVELPEIEGATKDRILELINELRTFIRDSGKPEHDPPKVIIKAVQMNKSAAGKVLRWLEEQGEYNGHTRPPRRSQSKHQD